MRKSLSFGICILLICSIFIPINLAFNVKVSKIEQTSNFGNGSTLYVGGDGPGNYSTIQEAVNDAVEGDTVFVYDDSSPYYENIIIMKQLHLIGENKNTTIIDGTGTEDVIYVSSNNVKISNFLIRNAGDNYYPNYDAGIDLRSKYNTLTNNIIHTGQNGIYLENSDYNEIIGNIVFDTNGWGIRIYSSSNNSIKNNNVQNDSWNGGILIHYGSNNNLIQSNIIHNNTQNSYSSGIQVHTSRYATITGNHLLDNDHGISLYQSSNCKIINNFFKRNGAGISVTSPDVVDNQLYHNNFLNNGLNCNDIGNNIWDNGYPSGGNYWDDYTGIDENIDGIGDTPYNIPGGSNQDNYPLMYPCYSTHPDIVYVDKEYNSSISGFGYNRFNRIQYGINEVGGSTVFVYSGLYYENVFIDKTVNLTGEDRNTTIIDASGVGEVINISADEVNVCGFTIQNSGGNFREDAGINIHSHYNTIFSNNIKVHKYGIRIINSKQNNLITDNRISECYRSIFLNDTNFNNVVKNTISNNDWGILLKHSSNNIISNNVLLQNVFDGISLDDFSNNNSIMGNSIYYSSMIAGITLQISNDNTIKGNDLSDNTAGIVLIVYSENNIIMGNNISKNSFTGIRLSDSSSNSIIDNDLSNNNISIMLHRDSNNNIVYHNNFVDNAENAFDECDNIWDDGKYGNFWSDYKDKYPNARKKWFKGIWNTPYEIPGGMNKDMCPLVNQWPNSRPRTIKRDTPLYSSYWLRLLDMFPILQRMLDFIR